MTLRHLRIFSEVCRQESITLAAEYNKNIMYCTGEENDT